MAEQARQRDRGTGGVRARAASWLAWSLASLSVAMFLAGVALYLLNRFVHGDGAGGTVGDADLAKKRWELATIVPAYGGENLVQQSDQPLGRGGRVD